mmetsp:Transcript_11011/g.26917  ORF Transcript_11011/g.26917 Transcript_11011/m.26917 type:complete len:140 (+) Transcript_11011:1777-2196(+)
MVVAERGHKAVVLALIEAGAVIDKAKDDGMTALLLAAAMGQEAVLVALLRAGATVELADTHGYTPIFYAAEIGSMAMVSALLEAGANPEKAGNYRRPARVQQRGASRRRRAKEGHTPLAVAAQHGHWAVVAALWRGIRR